MNSGNLFEMQITYIRANKKTDSDLVSHVIIKILF